MSIATVKHITKDHVRISPSPGYSVTLFTPHNGQIEACVTADDGSETIRLRVDAPAPGRMIGYTVGEHREVDIKYTDKVDGY